MVSFSWLYEMLWGKTQTNYGRKLLIQMNYICYEVMLFGMVEITDYRKVASSRPVYYSIFDYFWGATKWDVLLTETCYYSLLQQSIKGTSIQSHLKCRIRTDFSQPLLMKMQNSGESRGSPRIMIRHVKISLHFMMKIAKIGHKLW